MTPEPSKLTLMKKEDGIWLSISGKHTFGLVRIETKSSIVLKAIDEVIEDTPEPEQPLPLWVINPLSPTDKERE